MRLKSLEIKGFKSFADKTILNFDEGITGVIGPNGCGKSNIIDSIRWVIGEQKISQLRSDNLESLVFNGSKNRSASGLAEVSLTFENTKNLLPTEFNTVTVTRKYYKNGESEYRLNDVTCRLKDIHNLFMDTGISTDSYAIIELGMVDDIIRDKDGSRRRMLEQAAGITIYKTRKKEAKLKLDATEQDLARIEDLLFEISNQLKTLENQAKKAQKYLEVKSEYRSVSIELAKVSLEGFNDSYHQLNEDQKRAVDVKTELEAQIAVEEAALEKEKLEFVARESALQQLQQRFNELNNKVKEQENKKNLSAQRLQHLRERENNLKEFIVRAEGQIKGLEESIDFTQSQITEETAKLENQKLQLEKYKNTTSEKRATFDEKRNKVDGLRQSQMQLQKESFDAEKKVAISDTFINNLERSLTQLREEKQVRQQSLTELEQKKIQNEEALAHARKELQKLQEENELVKSKILDSQKNLEELRNTLISENRILDARQNEYDLLKSLIDKMEGYPESVKYLHENTSWKHAAPLLSDIIYVKEEYRAALENVLEPYLNYYVVDQLEDGLEAIKLLDEHKKGKANFFLLDRISEEHPSIIQGPEDAIAAMDVIEIDEKYRPLALYLLSKVFIAQNPELLQEQHAGIVLLDPSGKIVKGTFSLYGGSLGMFEGKKIGRAKNLEKLLSSIEQQKQKVDQLKNKISDKSGEVLSLNESLVERRIQQKQEEVNALINSGYSVQNKIENLSSQHEISGRREIEMESQLKENVSSISKFKEDLNQLSQKVASLNEEMHGLGEEFKQAEEEFNQSNREYNDYNLQLIRQQGRLSSLTQELNFKNQQLNELTEQSKNSSRQLEETIQNLTITEDELKTSEQNYLEYLKEKEAEEKKLNEADQTYYNLRNALSEKEAALRQKQKSKEQADTLLNESKDKLNELKLHLAGMKERLNVEFKVNLDDIIDEGRDTDLPQADLQEKSDRLKKRLENIGEINPTAIEAFTEMKARFDFIEVQKNDLVSAKDSLLQTIQEVETTANQKFLETFNQVRENFQKVFKALFTEDDTADLIMENPENLAETSIDIIAKPKGKKPTSITQLSGGEKTLTATALLFAIYLIKPAPFCILDEVDAPLDDANVGKFTQMIRKFSKESQFIIVTHNKMTMASVDVIYGVTMQEPGVSKLVPVDFRGLTHEFVN